MLVLSRKLGEKITIGEGVTISVVKVQGNRVQLGISAPAHVRVFRNEIQERLEETASGACASGEYLG